MIFQSPAHESFFLKNGYLIVDHYSDEEIDSLLARYAEANPSITSEYFSTIDSGYEMKNKINALLNPFFTSFTKRIFTKHQYIFGAFTVKKTGDESVKPSHQDWSFVDERTDCGIGLWCPLVEVDEYNGCLGVLPGSHNYMFNYRGTGTKTEFEAVSQYMEKHLFKFLPMKKGQVLVFDNRIIHFSKPNKSSAQRIVAGCATARSDAQLLHYVGKENGKTIQMLEVERSFFIKEDFSKITFAENTDNRQIELNEVTKITHKQLFEFISKHDPRLLYRLRFALKSKLIR